MDDLRQGFLLPSVEREHSLPFLAHLSTRFTQALAVDLRFRVQRSGQITPFLPHWDDEPQAGQDAVVEFREFLARSYAEGTGRVHDLSRKAAKTENLERSVPVTDAAVLTLALSANPKTRERTSQKILLFSESSENVAEDLAMAIQRSRHSFVSAFQADGSQQLTVVRLNDASEDGATMDGLRALKQDSLAILAANETPNGTIWLGEEQALPREVCVVAGEVLSGLKEANTLPDDHDLVLFKKNEELYYTVLPRNRDEKPSTDLLQDHAPRDLMSLRRLEYQPSELALKALADQVVSRRFPVGYRISLRLISASERSEEDIEAIREEIAEREAEIDLIRSLAAPQLCLLRFSDAQLPALIDGLRTMPPETQRMAGLTYASAHSAGHEGPIHYILYDPGKFSLEGRVPEHYWRARTQDTPISYWLDPHAAATLNQAGNDPLVFVPKRYRLIPAINGFGGTLSETLRLILGNLFVDAAPILNDRNAKPAFLFSPSSEDWAEMDVELLDANSFRPIHLSMKILNDHLLVRSPRIIDREMYRQLVEDLYEGHMAERITSEAACQVSTLNQVWQDAQCEISAIIDSALENVRKEVQSTRAQIRRSYDFLKSARTHVEDLNALITRTRTITGNANKLESQLSALPDTMRLDRYEAISTILSEIQKGNAVIDEAENRLAENMEKLARLKMRLRQL